MDPGLAICPRPPCAHHLDRDQQRSDLDRVRTMERAGWLVLRFGIEDLRDRQRQMIAEIKAAIRQRSR